MAELSDNFGLQIIQPGDTSLTINGYAFTDSNIRKIDSLLASMMDHQHTGESSGISDPTEPPTLTLDTTFGNIPAGTTARYRFSLVDQFGNETAAGPEATITTPSPIARPGSASLSYASTGGSLKGGIYRYVLTAYVPTDTAETNGGTVSTISVPFTTTTNVITLTLPSLPSGATGFNVYRRGPNEASYNYLASVNMLVATPPTVYVDTGGTPPNCDRRPPNANNTNATNNITVTYPGATPTVPPDVTWKIYRTYISGGWSGSNLHHVLEETFDGSGIINPEYVDIGYATGNETAPERSFIVSQPDKITLTNAQEVEGYLPTGLLIVPSELSWYRPGLVEIESDLDLWRCPYDDAEIQEVYITLRPGNAPAIQYVIVDVRRYGSNDATPAWSSIFTNPLDRPDIPIGEWMGTSVVPDTVALTKGDLLTWDIVQDGGGATPTDYDLTLTILLHINQGSETVTNDITT